MPLRLRSTPPLTTVVRISLPSTASTCSVVAEQTAISHADPVLISRRRVVLAIEREGCARLQFHTAALEALDADLRALQIGQHGHLAAHLFGDLTHLTTAQFMILGRTVRQVQPDHIGAGLEHPREHAGLVGGRPEGGDDAGAAQLFVAGGHDFGSDGYSCGPRGWAQVGGQG
jgi:hypothetical protein